jgi:hypothetical protein
MSTRNAIVLVLTAVCAALGGLLGLRLVELGAWRSMGVVTVGVIFGVVVALGVLTAERQPVRRTVLPAPARPVFAEAVPTPEPAAGNRTWWTETPTPATAAPADPQPPPGQGYDVGRAVVAQCPRCGDFRLDLAQDADSYAFHCRNPNCGHRWEWRAGAPWPTTVVRRNLTG